MKSLINAEDGSDLSPLSPVLTCIRTLNESGFIVDEERSKYITSLSLKRLKTDEEVLQKDGFWFAVSLRDGACLYTSEAISHHLGYPKDMLVGQCFMNFLYHKDHITFANHLTQGLNVCFTQGKRDDSHLVTNTFFCRIRVYQGLKFGYAIADSKAQYKPFKIILHINELILDDLCVEKPLATLCVRATATQVLSAYSVPREIPAMTSFSTRHTASCHFSHVDACAIPYLGFLPQDMVGFSIFDFYHIDDMPQLKEIYELIIKEHGSSFRSKPYRFKAHNGCFIMLETEWSCFINPWSHKLEFVVGQHRVLKGPSDISIFTHCEILETAATDEILKESITIQKEIKKILSQPLENFELKKNKRLCSKRKRDLASFVYSCIDETNKANNIAEKQDTADDGGSHSDPDSVVMGDISPYRETNDESVSSPPTIQQMRYQENIERFFASQPKTYSDGSDDFSKNEKLSSIEDYQGSSSGSGNGSGIRKEHQSVSINYDHKTKESGSSSSKCNMSSFTTGDSGYGKSWEKEVANDPSLSQVGMSTQTRRANLCENDSITFASCLSLTEETLCAHNKITHKQIKHRNSSSAFTKIAMPIKETKKITHDGGHSKIKKHSRNHNSSSQIPVSTDINKASGTQTTNIHSISNTEQNKEIDTPCVPNTSHSCKYHQNACLVSGSTPPFFIPVVYMGSLPCYPNISAMNPFWPCVPSQANETTSGTFPINSTCNLHLNHIVPSFPYPSFPSHVCPTNCYHGVQSSGVTTTSLLSTTTTTLASSTSTTFKDTMAGERYPDLSKIDIGKMKLEKTKELNTEGNESYMQIEESLSSFTKSSHQTHEKEEEMDLDEKKCYAASYIDKFQLNSEIAYRYQMDISNVDEVLKKDREFLKLIQQPDLVNKQLEQLHSEINDENETKPKTEDDFSITEDIMLGLTTEESVNEELEYREASLFQLMCGE